MVARDPHDPLHKGLGNIDRVAEDDDVAIPWLFVWQDVLAERSRWCIGQLVHQQMIADEECVLHRSRWNNECLNQCGSAEQKQQNGNGPFGDRSSRRLWLGSRRVNCRGLGYRGLTIRGGFHSTDTPSLPAGGRRKRTTSAMEM